MEEKKVSGVKGITWRENRKKWIVQTTVDGMPYPSKCFSTLSQAKKFLKKVKGDLLIEVKKKDHCRIAEIKEAKEYIKNQEICGVKYIDKKDLFEVEVKLSGESDFLNYYYSSSEAFRKYHLFKEYQSFLKKPRRNIQFDREKECWISIISINGFPKEVGRFPYYFDALDATVQAEEENPDFDRDI